MCIDPLTDLKVIYRISKCLRTDLLNRNGLKMLARRNCNLLKFAIQINAASQVASESIENNFACNRIN